MDSYAAINILLPVQSKITHCQYRLEWHSRVAFNPPEKVFLWWENVFLLGWMGFIMSFDVKNNKTLSNEIWNSDNFLTTS